MFAKLIAAAASGLVGLALTRALPDPDPQDEPPPKAKAKHKAKEKEKEKAKGEFPPGPAGDLGKAYVLLRRLRSDDQSTGRPEARLRDWTRRASALYRKGVDAYKADDLRLAHEYGASAHDLARAVEHARNAALFDAPDDDLPAPPPGPGPDDDAGGAARRDLRLAYRRITELDDRPARERDAGPDAAFYRDAATDLYNAALADAGAGRHERARQLARAAEAMTHVVEHLGHAAVRENSFGPGGPEPKAWRERLEPKKAPLDDQPGGDLPPPIRRGR
jgi:hypothetical protein